jgi:hypothetical protein
VDTPQGLTTRTHDPIPKRVVSHPETFLETSLETFPETFPETFQEAPRLWATHHGGLLLLSRLALRPRRAMDGAGAFRVVAKRPHSVKPLHYRVLRIPTHTVPGEQTETAIGTSTGGTGDPHPHPAAPRYETCATVETNETSLRATSTSTELAAIPETGLLPQGRHTLMLRSSLDRRIVAVASVGAGVVGIFTMIRGVEAGTFTTMTVIATMTHAIAFRIAYKIAPIVRAVARESR